MTAAIIAWGSCNFHYFYGKSWAELAGIEEDNADCRMPNAEWGAANPNDETRMTNQ
jgi:hypothetical protein